MRDNQDWKEAVLEKLDEARDEIASDACAGVIVMMCVIRPEDIGTLRIVHGCVTKKIMTQFGGTVIADVMGATGAKRMMALKKEETAPCTTH